MFIHSLILVSLLHLSCTSFVLSCLLSLMATLEERIRDLEANIKGYEQEYANASPEEKKELRPLITASRNNLTALLQQQQQGE